MLAKIVRDALLIWTTIDPPGTVLLFAALTAGLTEKDRRATAVKATVISAIILLISIVAGQALLSALGVRLISLQVAGGLVLFLFGLQMIFGTYAGSGTTPEEGHNLAVFPLAIPTIAGPGVITAVIVATDNALYSIAQQAVTACVLLGVLGVNLVMMLLASRIVRVTGRQGAEALVRVMGMLLAALSVELVMEALGAERWVK